MSVHLMLEIMSCNKIIWNLRWPEVVPIEIPSGTGRTASSPQKKRTVGRKIQYIMAVYSDIFQKSIECRANLRQSSSSWFMSISLLHSLKRLTVLFTTAWAETAKGRGVRLGLSSWLFLFPNARLFAFNLCWFISAWDDANEYRFIRLFPYPPITAPNRKWSVQMGILNRPKLLTDRLEKLYLCCLPPTSSNHPCLLLAAFDTVNSTTTAASPRAALDICKASGLETESLLMSVPESWIVKCGFRKYSYSLLHGCCQLKWSCWSRWVAPRFCSVLPLEARYNNKQYF